ncbi:MAG: recombinase family protein [Dissulfurispiraceae bacterium]
MGDLKTLTIIQYRRKSTEGDERQIASLSDQAAAIHDLIARLGIDPSQILDDVEEAKSAKQTGRTGFNARVIQQIAKGHANAIICWHADRLSRNAIDTAALINLMDLGKLQAIVTNQQIFWNTPMDKFMLALFCGQAKLENDNKSVNVKRGLAGKVRKGWRPGVAPLGYLNNKTKQSGERDILIDEERFSLMRKLWDLLLSGEYSVRKICEIANRNLSLTTRKTKRQGGKPLSLSLIYEIFNEPFYSGWYWWNNSETRKRELVKGNHQPMITEDEFEQGQAILGRPWKPHPRKHTFSYTGLIRCGECGGSVTAEDKWQTRCGVCKKKFSSLNRSMCPFCQTSIEKMEHKRVLHYVYYRCTKRRTPSCSQKYAGVEELEKDIDQALKKISFKEKYLKWAIKMLSGQELEEKSLQKKLGSHFKRETTILKEELVEINKFIIKQELSGWTLMKKEDAIAERMHLEKQISEYGNNDSRNESAASLQAAMDMFRFAYHARVWFRDGTVAQKKSIASLLGSNLILRDKKLSIDLTYPLSEIAHMIQIAPEMSQEFEPPKNHDTERIIGTFKAKIPALLRGLNAVRTCGLPQLQPFHEFVQSVLQKGSSQ